MTQTPNHLRIGGADILVCHGFHWWGRHSCLPVITKVGQTFLSARTAVACAILTCFLLAPTTFAQLSGPATPDKVSQRVGIDQRLGEHVDLTLPFKDDTGKD